ncbi:hypothetical protein [Fimbriiglobus ruber]|uniref:hypothetical protein n=1 Tax=Fimbriiglobus ruber TaxID=1908690 RepID=UPI00117B2806|nr:hypothetical protein [Fimbriiglobus ruber]
MPPFGRTIEAKRRQAIEILLDDHYHTVANPAEWEKPGKRGSEPPRSGDRLCRNTQKRRHKP